MSRTVHARLWLTALTLTVLVAVGGRHPARADRAFAPVPSLPAHYDDPLYAKIVAKMRTEMPSAKRVPAPRCEGCVAMQLWEGEDGTWPCVHLLSPSTPEKVAAFYRKALSGWQETKQYDFEWVFWKGKALEMDSLHPRVPHVVIHAVSKRGLDRKLFPRMKTQVTVFFPPLQRSAPAKTPPEP